MFKFSRAETFQVVGVLIVFASLALWSLVIAGAVLGVATVVFGFALERGD